MSQFIEMFGHAEKTKALSDFIEVSFPGEWGQEDKDGNGVKVIRTTNFTNTGKLNLADVVTRDIDSNKVEKKKLKKGDIILERSGGTNDNPVGRVVYFNEDGLYLFNNFTQLLRCKEEVNSLFIFYSLFNYYQMNKRIIRSMGNKTTGIQNLKMDQYWQIPIADVSLELQERFVSIYHQADKSEFDVIKSQFIEMFNGEFPLERWEECLTITNGKKYDGEYQETGTYPICGSGGIMGYGEQKLCPKDTVILGRKGNINSPIYMESDYWIVDTAFCLDVDKLKLQPKFFYYWCILFDFTRYNKQGVLPSLTKNDLLKIEIPIPPMELQTRFVNIQEQADKSESVCHLSIHDLINSINYN